MSKLANVATITILLGAALCLIIPSLLRLRHLTRSRSKRVDAPYSAKPMPVRAKAVAPIADAKVTAFR
jgi:hypothetical protein